MADPRFAASVGKWQAALEKAERDAQQRAAEEAAKAAAPAPKAPAPAPSVPPVRAINTTAAPVERGAPYRQVAPAPGLPWKTNVPTKAGTVALPPGAAEVESPWWGRDVAPEKARWESSASPDSGLWGKLFGDKAVPKWLSDASSYADYIVSGIEGRAKEAWDKPELRYQTRLPGGTESDLERTGQAIGVPSWKAAYTQSKEDVAGAEGIKKAGAVISGAGKVIGGGWDEAAGKSPLLRGVEQAGAAGLSLLDSVGRVPKEI